MRRLPTSSEARVRPFFEALMARDPSGRSWLGQLLAAAPRAQLVPEALRQDPGALLPHLSRRQANGLLGCFERPVPPSRAFLEWLIDHPEQLQWPRRRGGRATFGPRTQRWREDLASGEPDRVRSAQEEARRELKRLGPEGARRQWWAFEGTTYTDCWLETNRLLLVVEGKWREQLSKRIDWYPARDQLMRNLEVATEVADGRPAFVLLAVEHAVPEPNARTRRAAAPHLTSAAVDELWRRYLGQATWLQLTTAVAG